MITEANFEFPGQMVEMSLDGSAIRETDTADGMILDELMGTIAGGTPVPMLFRSGWYGEDGDDRRRFGRASEKLSVPTFTAEDSEDLGGSARSYLRQLAAWRQMTLSPHEPTGAGLVPSLGRQGLDRCRGALSATTRRGRWHRVPDLMGYGSLPGLWRLLA